jgi:2-amino-4-hydroxy-6-hydroxymethyldihydropteridine diphosphokinase
VIDALLSLGGNIGDRRAFIDEAVARLARLSETTITARSGYYRTAPVGPVAQAWFLNVAVALRTALSPVGLAAAGHAIEADLGRDRTREIPWGPRVIDIDLVAYADAGAAGGLRTPNGTPPAQAFVLAPLAEIAPDESIAGVRIADRLAAADTAGVERLDWAHPSPDLTPGRVRG